MYIIIVSEDISLYGADRFRMAREVCEIVLVVLNEIGEENKQRLEIYYYYLKKLLLRLINS